ncbi:DNA-binding protein HU 1 [compost metagenome]
MANKTDLVNEVYALVQEQEVEISKKDTTKVVDAVLDAIIGLTGEHEKLQLVGFGNFEARTRKARKGHNPQDPTIEIDIPEKRVPAFKPGKHFKDFIAK